MKIPAAVILSAILSLAVVAWAGNPTYTVLHTFQGSPNDGANPENVGTLFRDASGNIYGTTQNGPRRLLLVLSNEQPARASADERVDVDARVPAAPQPLLFNSLQKH